MSTVIDVHTHMLNDPWLETLLAKGVEYEAAAKDIDKAIALNPGQGRYHYYRGKIFQEQGKSPCGEWKKARSLGFKFPEDKLTDC